MVRKILGCLLAAAFFASAWAGTAHALPTVQFSGDYGFTFSPADRSVTFTVAKLANPSTTYDSGALRLELWLTTTRYGSGGTTNGYRVAAYAFTTASDDGTLPARYYYHDVERTVATIAAPAAGTYYATLLAMEKTDGCTTSDGFCPAAYVNFANPVVVTASGGIVRGSSADSGVMSGLRVGAVFSSGQTSSQSFVRFANTGTTAGSVTLALSDDLTGRNFGQVTSPSIPAGASVQYFIGDIEQSLNQAFATPNFYTLTVQSGITGTFQHVLWRASNGTFTNLSTCGTGVAADPAKLNGVHSALLQSGYPSTVVVNNTGTAAASVALGIYDARNGAKLGTYNTPSIPAGGQVLIPAANFEDAAGAATTGMFHYGVKAEGAFTGFLQHLLNNTKADVVTDMTTVCALPAPASNGDAPPALRVATEGSTAGANSAGDRGVESAADSALAVVPTFASKLAPAFADAGGGEAALPAVDAPPTSGKPSREKPAAGQTSLRLGATFSSAQAGSQSFLRVYNTSAVAGTAVVSLSDSDTGAFLGKWTSPSIPAGAETQFAIGTIERELGLGANKPDYYSVAVQSSVAGYFQHILWRTSNGTLTNLSTCSAGVSADPARLSGVHTPQLDSGFPSTVVVNNTGAAAAAVTLGVYDARDGRKLGAYTTSSIPAGGQVLVGAPAFEQVAGPATPGMYHYVIKAEGSFTGFLQHLVVNQQAGVITDMTTVCALSASALEYTLTTSTAGAGAGTVTASPSATVYAAGTAVTLTATPNTGSDFANWSGACSGTDNICRVTMNANTSVTAQFNINPNVRHRLTTLTTGTGTGTVTPTPSLPSYAGGEVVTLRAAPGPGATFSGWSGGGCSGTSPTCRVTMLGATTVTATFNQTSAARYSLDLGIDSTGSGSGKLVTSPTGQATGPTVSSFPTGTFVIITATPNTGSSFEGWSGGRCSGTSPTCEIVMNSDFLVRAKFSIASKYRLTTTSTGTGTGNIAANPAGSSFLSGTSVTLSAAPAAGSTFAGWSGGRCTGTGTCTIKMTADTSVGAIFNDDPNAKFPLDITIIGTGEVKRNLPGPTYARGTVVTLTASTSDPHSRFFAWELGCKGTAPTCQITIGTSNPVMASFASDPKYVLLADTRGAGYGEITFSPRASSYYKGDVVVVRAIPNSGSTFAGWSTGCSGTSTTCEITVRENTVFTGTFNIIAGTPTTPKTPTTPTTPTAGGRDAQGCMGLSTLSGNAVVTNHCGEKVYIIYCGVLKYSRDRCNDGGRYFNHSTIFFPGENKTYYLEDLGSFRFGACYGGLGFFNDGNYKDFPNGSYICLK